MSSTKTHKAEVTAVSIPHIVAGGRFQQVAELTDNQAFTASQMVQACIANSDQQIGRAILQRAREFIAQDSQHAMAWRGVLNQWASSRLGRDDVDLTNLD